MSVTLFLKRDRKADILDMAAGEAESSEGNVEEEENEDEEEEALTFLALAVEEAPPVGVEVEEETPSASNRVTISRAFASIVCMLVAKATRPPSTNGARRA